MSKDSHCEFQTIFYFGSGVAWDSQQKIFFIYIYISWSHLEQPIKKIIKFF